MKKNQIALSSSQRQELQRFSETGVHSAMLVRRAKIILTLDTYEAQEKYSQEQIARFLGVSRQTLVNVKKDFHSADSVSCFLQRKKRISPPRTPKVTGELEAKVIALACSEAPEGYARWTVQLIADKCVELHYIDSISHMTVHRLLKKHNLNLI